MGCFARLEASLLEKVTSAIAPHSAQFTELKSSVVEVAQTADSAMELGLATQDHGRQLQQHAEWPSE